MSKSWKIQGNLAIGGEQVNCAYLSIIEFLLPAMHAPISIIESHWENSGNQSVKGIFHALGQMHYKNPSAFRYSNFSDETSLAAAFEARANDLSASRTDANTEVIYLGTHGSYTHIGPTNLSRTKVRNIIVDANKTTRIKGLYLGICLTGTADFSRFLIEGGDTNLDWVAGYTEVIDWADSTAIDMIFFNKLIRLYVENKKLKKGKLSARSMAHLAATELISIAPGAHSKFGFNIFFHEGGKLTSMFNVSARKF